GWVGSGKKAKLPWCDARSRSPSMFFKQCWGMWERQPGVARSFGTCFQMKRRRPLVLEPLEDRTLLSGRLVFSHLVDSAHPTYVLFQPLGDPRPAGSPTPITSALTPAQVRHAYGLDQLAEDGLGMTIAIIDAYDNPKFVSSTDPNFNNSDLHQFDLKYNLPE